MKTYTYAVNPAFPSRYLPLASAAFRTACEAWEDSGVVRFIPATGREIDIVVSMRPIPARIAKEDGERKLELMVTHRSIGEIVVNGNVTWKASPWRFSNIWGWLWEPEIFAHEIGHILFESSDHSRDRDSVMHYTAPTLPTERDFAALRQHLQSTAPTR